MKILLVTPPYKFEEIYPEYMGKQTNLGKKFGLIPGAVQPLGLLYIASVAKHDRHELYFLDGVFETKDDIKNWIRSNRPDLIGVSTTTTAWESAKSLIREIKEEFADIPIIVGGAHADAWKENCLYDCKEADFMAYGESDYTFKDFVRELQKVSPDFSGVDGLVYRQGGKIIKNPERPLTHNLDEIPFPDRDLAPLERYCPAIGHYKRLPNATLITSRGCPNRCIFCHTDPRIRFRSVEDVLAEIDLLVNKYKIKDLLFWDDNLVLKPDRLIKICEGIIKRKYNLTWSASSRVDTINPTMLKFMKKSGCWKLLYGIESGVQKNLDTLKKGTNIEKIRKTIKETHRAGISTFGMFMFGIPGETFKDGLETIDFACSLKLDFAKFCTLTPFPGTELWNNLDKYGKMTTFKDMDIHHVSFIPYSMTKEEIEKLFHLAYKRFYQRPEYLLQKIINTRSLGDIKQNYRGFLSFIKNYSQKQGNKTHCDI